MVYDIAFLFLVSVVSLPAEVAAPSGAPLDLAPYLEPTPYIDSRHPDVVEVARKVTAGVDSQREKAVLLHDFVRDEILFGWAPAFYDQQASGVLRSGVGFCNTKSTLFIALLRASGIAARQYFVSLDSRILRGLIAPGTAQVDHSFVEVRLDGRWRRVDSFIVDRSLAERARARLAEEGAMLGYGVHLNGVSDWDGHGDAFAQFVDDGAVPGLSASDHGVFRDVGAFYASGRGLNRLNVGLRLLFGFFSRRANARAEELRSSTLD